MFKKMFIIDFRLCFYGCIRKLLIYEQYLNKKSVNYLRKNCKILIAEFIWVLSFIVKFKDIF